MRAGEGWGPLDRYGSSLHTERRHQNCHFKRTKDEAPKSTPRPSCYLTETLTNPQKPQNHPHGQTSPKLKGLFISSGHISKWNIFLTGKAVEGSFPTHFSDLQQGKRTSLSCISCDISEPRALSLPTAVSAPSCKVSCHPLP